jgi:hypothetical protein
MSVDDKAAARLSLLYAVGKLRLDGFSVAECAAVLGVATSQVFSAVHDPRFDVICKRILIDKGADDTVSKARAQYRLERAWEVLESELDHDDKWIKHQAALAIIAASKADKTGSGRTELVVSPELAFDDQDPDDLQDDVPDDADSDDLTQFDAQYSDDA